jgi:hypothetical protein
VPVNFSTTAPEHIPVTNITGVPTTATVSESVELTGTVVPSNATNQTIVWSVQSAGTTGATITNGNMLNTTDAGTVVITATIANGTAVGTPYTQSFDIAVSKGNQTPPDAPTLAEKTTTTITLDTIANCEYRKDEGTWQPSSVFSGLTPNTTYSFEARKVETATHLPSNPSEKAYFTTDDVQGNIYTITATVNNSIWGSISPNGECTVEEGESITFTITPTAIGEIEDVKVNGISKGAIDTYTFENVQADGTIAVVFKKYVGIEAITNDELRITIYPNPTTGEFRIENGELRMESIEILDVNGRKILYKQVSNLTSHISSLQLDISHLQTGVYFVRIFTEAGEVVKKILHLK